MKNKLIHLTVPHGGKEINFKYPVVKGSYENVFETLKEKGLRMPTSAETASLVYDAFNHPKEKYSKEIISIMENNLLWESTGNLYLPKSSDEVNDGVILVDNFDKNAGMNKSSLIKRLQDEDPAVRFIPFGFKKGEQSISELVKNEYVIGKYGEEGAQKIAEIASKYSKQPHIWSSNFVYKETTRVSAQYIGRDFYGFEAGNYLWDLSTSGQSFGIIPE